MTCRSRLSRRLGAVLLVVAGVALCAGCGGSSRTADGRPHTAVSPSAGSQGPSIGSLEPSASSGVANGSDADATGTLASVGPPPADTSSTQRAAVSRAVAFMIAFIEPTSTARWFAGVRPYLSTAGRVAYGGTDPQNIPARKIEGNAVLVAFQPTVARVAVPTNAGIYAVILTRLDVLSDWAVERAIPQGDAG